MRTLLLRATTAGLAVLCCSIPASGQIVNVSATTYGFYFPNTGTSDPAPVPGQTIVPITNPSGTPLNQLTLGPGTYSVTNAAGLTGANFDAWRFNYDPNWVWNFVIADNARNKVLVYGEAGGIQGSEAAIATQPAVQNFFTTFTLASQTTVDFMIRDYYLPDNAGGVSLQITPLASTVTPEPTSMALMATGLVPLVGAVRRRRR